MPPQSIRITYTSRKQTLAINLIFGLKQKFKIVLLLLPYRKGGIRKNVYYYNTLFIVKN